MNGSIQAAAVDGIRASCSQKALTNGTMSTNTANDTDDTALHTLHANSYTINADVTIVSKIRQQRQTTIVCQNRPAHVNLPSKHMHTDKKIDENT